MPIHLQAPDRLVIYVSDMERSVAFYRDILGLPLKFSSPGWSEFNNSGTTLALHRHLNPGGEDVQAAHAAAGQATYETLKAEGAHFSMEPQKQPTGLTFAILPDPDGFTVTLQQKQA